jgi:Protein of unknown function (DUF2591)
MKIKTGDLTGPVLDWAVAKVLFGDRIVHKKTWLQTEDSYFKGSACDWCPDSAFVLLTTNWQGTKTSDIVPYSTDPAQAWPIIEREKINIVHLDETLPDAMAPHKACVGANIDGLYQLYGPTLLIATMRCFVTSKLGEEVDIPDELVHVHQVAHQADVSVDDSVDDDSNPAEPAPAP